MTKRITASIFFLLGVAAFVHAALFRARSDVELSMLAAVLELLFGLACCWFSLSLLDLAKTEEHRDQLRAWLDELETAETRRRDGFALDEQEGE